MENGQNASAASASNNSSDFVRKLYKYEMVNSKKVAHDTTDRFLFRMLEDPSDGQVVRWGNDGNSFVVLENERFTKSILPKHFKHSNFASFVRQLNKYDFHKVRHNNEESGQSPYGANAWEFKHPEFKIGGKDSLENIRRKAPAARKSVQSADDLVPTSQIDLVNTQLVAMQQQLQQLSDRYNELSVHYSMLLTELIGVQKSVVNHESVMQNVMTYLHSADSFIRGYRRNARADGTCGTTAQDGPASAMTSLNQQSTQLEETLPSPLQNAEKLLNDASAETLFHHRNLEQINEFYRQANSQINNPSPETIMSRDATNITDRAESIAPNATPTIDFTRLNNDLQDAVYPVGHSNGIDPMFGEHINNIPYPTPASTEVAPTDPRKHFSDGRKKSASIDPGWIRAPQILLVEDDPTCRRIGGKFLYSFKCAIDSAFDGLEAVNKMNGGSKYDLVLMDIIMPNLDGVSACHLIRQFDSTPIIAMTSNIRSDDISMYFAHGMNDVLPKPFTKEGLLTMLEKHLGHLKDTRTSESIQANPMTHGPARHTLKDDNSSVKSEATTTNWQSPTTPFTGISPQSQTLNDEYVSALSRTGPYGLDTSTQPETVNLQSPMAASRPGIHRRQLSQISDICGTEEQSDAKRQRLFPPPMSTVSLGTVQTTRTTG
ncbi:MAG: kinase-regulated stress-responsive transcription factor skn7 [Peltula sp. TS41687]|nr:MAG: kinase-regulated stress-responsive transcription factor skn7 [Peltula sp. TS41687]